MERIKLKIEYDGTNFSGWQLQPGKRTVQGELEKVISFLLRENVRLFASGRTDSGVSALGQIAHFDTECEVSEKQLLSSINALLPVDVSVRELERVGENFDARLSVKRKTYVYRFYISKFTRPLFRNSAFRVNDYVNLENMKQACKFLIGKHDFSSFVSRKSGKTDFVREIYDAKIVQEGDGIFAFEITGNGFLYNMVRIIFGTLLLAGYGKITPEEITKIIDGKTRANAGKTMPAYALVLKNVEYL